MASNSRNVVFHSLEARSPKSRRQRSLALSEGSSGTPFRASLGSWWFVEASLQHDVLPVSLVFLFYQDTSHWIRARLSGI